jgi:hypothetical protein
MRQKNWRMIIAGFVLIVMSIGFLLFMLALMPRSTDPVTMMRTVGTISGGAIGISMAMIIGGLIGKKI